MVEVDGIQHAWAENVVGDALRQNPSRSAATRCSGCPCWASGSCPDDFFDQIEDGPGRDAGCAAQAA